MPTPQLRLVGPAPSRLVLAASGGSTRSGALAIYRPRRRLARAGAAAAALRLRLGQGRDTQPPQWLAAALEATGVHPDQLAVMHTEAGRVVVGVQVGATLDVVLKGAPADEAGLRNERDYLRRLTAQDAAVSPELLWAGRANGWDVVATRGVSPVREPREDDVVALAARFAALGVVHGDLAPWNVLVGRLGVVACDWEAARDEALPLYDLTHYLAQEAALVGRRTPADVADRLVSADGPAARLVAALGADASARAAWLDAALGRLVDKDGDPPVRAFRRELAQQCRQRLASSP